MSFDRIIQSLQDMDPNIQQVKKIDLRFQELNEIPEITIDNHRRQIAALSNVEQSNEAIMSYDNMIKLIRPRTDEESILIWIDIPAINGGFVRGLLDSATTECIIQSEVVEQNKFLNRNLGANWLEVVGGSRKLQETYSLAVPINKDDVYRYTEMRAIKLEEIVDNIEEIDVTSNVDDAFLAYKEEMDRKKEPTGPQEHSEAKWKLCSESDASA